MTSLVVESIGYESTILDNGIAAMEAIAANPSWDAILSDMNMPLVSGLELFQELRQQGVTIPFILLTGDDPEPLLAQAPDLSGCIMKGGDLEESLSAILNRILST
ncbi:MAG: response regulator [Gammaproteobacteria bacterium]|nr:response regulator [Gammaproteobacteria bacterium]